jgi:diguanylate cyclase (GGDEF)-like protein
MTFLSSDETETLRQENQRLEEALKHNEYVYGTLIEVLSEGIVQQHSDGSISLYNPAAERMLGLSKAQLAGEVPRTGWQAVREDGTPFPPDEYPSRLTLRTGKGQKNVLMGIDKPSSERTWLLVNTKPLQDFCDPYPYAVVMSLTDITERKLLEDQLRQAALYDSLTGLASRTLLLERLNHAMAHAKREQAETLAVLFIDLNNFKQVNDTLGHQAGDDLLKQVATRLKAKVRETDTVARLGGDEFVILLSNPLDQESRKRFVERIMRALHFDLESPTGTITVTGSIGVANDDPSITCAEDLLAQADKAMYAEKALGKRQLIPR